MTKIQPQWTRRLLIVAISAVLSGQALALEAISDEEMSSATGEGIALLPENFRLVMEDSDTSYINLIPRGATRDPDAGGPLVAPNRADLYIRNLSITGNDATTTRASNSSVASWGSGANPFLIAVKSESQPDYVNPNVSRSFLRIEAPKYCLGISNTEDCPTANGADSGSALSAYNLRLGLTLDILSKTSAQQQGYIVGGTPYTGNGLFGNRGVAFQAIWNGLSINGTRVDVFQTPSNDPTANSQANGTLGLRALLRLNTDATAANQGLRLTTGLDAGYNGTTNRLFRAGEGITIQDLDINLPLGAPHYQSLVLGKADAAGNFYLELTRIPNDPDAYNAAYINYANAADVTAKTCTSTTCGTTAIPATHGTISMGNVTFRDINGANPVNLGSARIDGLFIQHLKLTTTGL